MELMGLSYLARLLFCTLLITTISHASQIDLVRYIESKKYPDPKQSYFVDLLALTLEASKDQYGEYKLQPINFEMAQARTSAMIRRKQYIDLTWRMTSQELENELQAVYFPIVKGLMGHRIFIIRKDQTQTFDKQTTLNDLRRLNIGQGHNWTDTDILVANGFRVTQGKDNLLIEMLKKGRFDYYPRALHEPWLEITNEGTLTVEKNLLLHYRAPMYFFVNKENKRLYERLSFGLKQLFISGRFDKFFQNHHVTSGILARANVKNRTIFNLHNPLLSMKTKELLTDDQLWIKLK
jgi:hypothetical protein